MMRYGRWAALAAMTVLTAACSGGASAPEASGEYPTKEIRVIVPYTAGGPTDLAARTMGTHLERALGEPVIVENLPGAAGALAMNELVSSDPDGHTLTLVAAPSTVVTPLVQDVSYGPQDFETIGVITEVPSVLAVGARSEFADAAAFVDAARARPGELTVGTPGATTSQGIELRRLASEYGVQVTVVPFNGNAELIQAPLGSTVDALLVNVSQDIRAQFDAGEFRPLRSVRRSGSTTSRAPPPWPSWALPASPTAPRCSGWGHRWERRPRSSRSRRRRCAPGWPTRPCAPSSTRRTCRTSSSARPSSGPCSTRSFACTARWRGSYEVVDSYTWRPVIEAGGTRRR